MLAEDAGFDVRDCLTVLGSPMATVWLLRKPITESTIAAQMLLTGTGGVWIDGCRVQGGPVQQAAGALGGYHGSPTAYVKGTGAIFREGGRWPANLVLLHTPECRQEGVKKVAGTSIHGTATAVRRSGVHSEAKGHQTIGRLQPVRGYSDPDGKETVTAWECSTRCCIPTLDTQSGVLKSGVIDGSKHVRKSSKGWSGPFADDLKGPACRGIFGGDSGGASRFFPQFGSEMELDAWLTRLILGGI